MFSSISFHPPDFSLNRPVTTGEIGRQIRGVRCKLTVTRDDNLHPISAIRPSHLDDTRRRPQRRLNFQAHS